MPEITIRVSDEIAGRLAVLTHHPGSPGPPDVEAVIYELIDHAQQGVYRPGSWERPWLERAFGREWLERMEPDTRTEMLSVDGRVIFDRPGVVTDGSEGEARDG